MTIRPSGELPTARDVIRGTDLTGKIALITGASSGLGIETARALSLAGADLILAVRNPVAGEAVAEDLRPEARGSIRVEALDLADLTSVQAFARRVGEGTPSVDLLIGNAGVSNTPDTHLPNGLDVRFATNHLGHYLLANRLLPQLKAGGGARIVMVSSAAHKRRPVQLDDLNWQSRPHDKLAAYGESKSANILFAVEVTRRWGGRGVRANAVLPGTILTGLQRHHSPELMREIGFFDVEGATNPMVRTAEQGAATSVWAAVSPELEGRGGLVLENCAAALEAGPDTHPWSGFAGHALDSTTGRALWDRSESLLWKLNFPPDDD